MPRQLTFHLPALEAHGRDDFFVSAANAGAVAALEDWQNWPQGKMVLTGPQGAGKSHLAQIWAAEAGAQVAPAQTLARADLPDLAQGLRVVVEDADRIAGDAAAETALFHLHNLLGTDGRLLLTARAAPSHWRLTLPDLASRMQASAVTTPRSAR